MKTIYRLIIVILLLMPFISQSMESSKRKLDDSEDRTNKKARLDLQDSCDSMTQWEDCPYEIKMYILWFTFNIDAAIEESIKAKNIKPILEIFKRRVLLKLTSKEMNDLVSDKQVVNVEQINKNLLESFPALFLELLKKAVKCKEMFQLPSGIVLPKGSNINSLFILASVNNHTQFCKQLIDAGIFENKCEDGNISLIHAIYLRDHDAVKKCIENGETSASLQNGSSQIVMAVETGDIEILNLLLDARAQDIDRKDNNGDTALMLAALKGYKKVARLLLDRGAHVNEVNNKRETALIKAIRGEKLGMVKLLLDKDANVNIRVGIAITILMLSIVQKNKKIIKVLLDKCDIDEQDGRGETALIQAARDRDDKTVKLLLRNNPNINHKSHLGYTALIYAAMSGRKKMIELLLAQGADINAVTNASHTALTLAITNKHYECVQVLQNHLNSLARH